MTKSISDYLKAVINSVEFSNFCEGNTCALKQLNCDSFCPIHIFNATFGGTT